MIGAVLQLANELIEVRINGDLVYFRSSSCGNQWAPIEGLRLSKAGVLREFPDLACVSDWEAIAISRFKEKIKSLRTEEKRMEYIIKDLQSHGYTPKFKQRQGFRPERL